MPIINHLNTSNPALATIVEHLSNQNQKRDIFHSEFHRGMGVVLYHSYWQTAFGVSPLAAPFSKTYLCIRTSYSDGGWLF